MIGELIPTGVTYGIGREALNYQFSGTGEFNNVEVSGNLSAGTGGVIYSGGTDLYNIFSTSSGIDYWTAGTGTNSIAQVGGGNISSGTTSVAEGTSTTAGGDYSHSEGYFTTASGDSSHAEGYFTTASGNYSHAEGSGTTASGLASHTEGFYTTASGDSSHAEGYLTTASGNFGSHAEGGGSIASGDGSHAEGGSSIASGDASHAEGNQTIAIGNCSHSEGVFTTASGHSSHAEGEYTKAIGIRSHAEGYYSQSIGRGSHAEGGYFDGSNIISGGTAFGTSSHAEGLLTTAIGEASHAEGYYSIASGEGSHAEGGILTFGILGGTASGGASHAEGAATTASGVASHAGGSGSIASGITSFIHSTNSLAAGPRSVVLGGQNITGTTADTVYVPYLNIQSLAAGTSVNNLGVDSGGNVVVGSAGGGATIDPYLNLGTTGSTITWNVSGLSTNYRVILSAATTLNLTNVRNGEYGTIIVTQDGVGGSTITFGTVNGLAATHRVVNGGGGAPTLTLTANATDILSFTYNGSAMYWTVGNDYT